jgi:peptidoglycan hydrolase CwlO-like protein
MFKQKQPISVQEYSKKKILADLSKLQKAYDKIQQSIDSHDEELKTKYAKMKELEAQLAELTMLQKSLH